MGLQQYVTRALMAAMLMGGCSRAGGGVTVYESERGGVPISARGSLVEAANRLEKVVDLNAPLSRQELEQAIAGECDATLTTDYRNSTTGKVETVLACLDQGSYGHHEARWQLNVDSICGIAYRDNMVGKDELFIQDDRGNAFTLFFSEDAAVKLGGYVQAYMPQNNTACLDVAQFQRHTFTVLGPLRGKEREEAQQRYASYGTRDNVRFATHGKEGLPGGVK